MAWRLLVSLVSLLVALGCAPASIGANVILRTEHVAIDVDPPLPYDEVVIAAEDIELRGWLFHAHGPRRGSVVFLHGRNQNRAAAIVPAIRLVALGYDVLAYDARAHGASGGEYSTFGYYEKRDLRHAIDYLDTDHVVVMGVSLGAAVALQAAAEDARIAGVVAVASYASFASIVRDQIPAVVPESHLEAMFREVERRAQIEVSEVDTVEAARHIDVPVLLLHGTADTFTRPIHSRRIYEALNGPKRLVLVGGAHHAEVLRFPASWDVIYDFLARYRPVLDPPQLARGARHLERPNVQRGPAP